MTRTGNGAGSLQLLDRDAFREAVFARDGHRCVNCAEPAVDAHHIIERRLFQDGGYYLANGASLCAECHWLAEQTVLGPAEIRTAAGIVDRVLPEGFDPGREYDKWGNPYLPDGRRGFGPLFDDENVQRVLRVGRVLDVFAWELRRDENT